MDWVQSLGLALRYVEEHLTDELNVALIARQVSFSPFYLQRIFSAMTDISLSEYIRQRRLSAAGQELRFANVKVIDVALKYGYETPESFQKAFRRFHGLTPSAARKDGANLRCRNPLQIQIQLTGGNIMDYCVESIGELTIRGMRREFPYDNAFGQIPAYWDEYFAKKWNERVPGYLGVCFDAAPGSPTFDYWIASFCEADAPVPEGFEKRTIPARTWVKFRAVGPMPGSIQKLNRQIYTEWLPANPQYELADGMNIEVYTEGDMGAADYVCEIWIPVAQK